MSGCDRKMGRSDEIEVETFVKLIKDRPVIWDKSVVGYRSSKIMQKVWSDIAAELVEGFESMNSEERFASEKTLIQKWNNMRVCWLRAFKKRLELQRAGQEVQETDSSIYSLLIFLCKVYNSKENSIQDKSLLATELSSDIETVDRLYCSEESISQGMFDISGDSNVVITSEKKSPARFSPRKTRQMSKYEQSVVNSSLSSMTDQKTVLSLDRKEDVRDPICSLSQSALPKMIKLEQDPLAETCDPRGKKRPREDVIANERFQYFVQSTLSPYIKNFDDFELIDLEMGVLHLVKKIKLKDN